ncbi:MAG TPA: zf-TFIIB domain-containing protein [Pyrinomonadaceae bacterium]
MLDGEKCVRCHKHFKFEELRMGPDGFAICNNCAGAVNNYDKELVCPNDGQALGRALVGQYLVANCAGCKGVWIEGSEIEKLRNDIHWWNEKHITLQFIRALLGDKWGDDFF